MIVLLSLSRRDFPYEEVLLNELTPVKLISRSDMHVPVIVHVTIRQLGKEIKISGWAEKA